MGYDTKFTGQVALSRQLTLDEHQILTDWNEERHEPSPLGFESRPWGPQPRSVYCQWVPNTAGTAIKWDEGEKFYDAALWMAYLIEEFLEPWGVIANGTIEAVGEDRGDLWTLTVEDNVVRVAKIDHIKYGRPEVVTLNA